MVADRVPLAHDAVDNAAEPEEAHVETRFLLDLAHERVLDALAEIHEAPRDAPLAQARRMTAPREQHAVAIEHHGAHADPRRVGKLARGCRHHPLTLPSPLRGEG